MKTRSAIAAVVLWLACVDARAVTSGIFESLSSLISQSDQIVVAILVVEPPLSAFGYPTQGQILVSNVLKGNLPMRKNIPVMLRDGLMLGGDNFHRMHQYVLFLQPHPEGGYALVNVSGSAFRAPRFKESELSADSVRGNVEILLRASLRESSERAELFERRAEEYLRSP